MFKKITNRILFGYSVPLFFLLAFGAIVYTTAHKNIGLKNKVIQASQILKSVDEITLDLNQMVLSTQGYLLAPKEANYRQTYEFAYQDFRQKAKELDRLIENTEEQKLLEQLITSGERLHELSETAFKTGDDNTSATVRNQVKVLQTKSIDVAREQLINQVQASIKPALAQLETVESYLLLLISLGTALVVLATVTIGLLISLPLQRQLRSLISQAQKSCIQVSTSTTQIAAAGKELEATVSEQVASISEVSATSQQISATAGNLAKTMEQVAQTTQEMTHTASQNRASLAQMQMAMQQLALSTTSIASKLGMMDEKASNINTVVTTITKVADQTNLLSLNAAIEAEKAGEYGAGFAVVAREIRRLADQTAVATLEIEQMVKEMQSSVSTGVMEMDKFSKEVGQYVEDVGKIGGQVAHVIEEVQSLAPQFEAASQGMDEQYQGAQQISTAIAQLSEASHQTMQSLQETNTALSQLDDAAQGLQQEITQFQEQV